MNYIKSIFILFIILAIAIITFQNISVLQILLVFKIFNFEPVKIPVYYFFLIFLAIIFFVILFYKIKYKILIRSKNKEIEKLEQEISRLKNIELSE